jgi:hypothetical protein
MDSLPASAAAHEETSTSSDSGIKEGDQRLGRYVAPQEIPPAPPLVPSRSEKQRMRAATRAVASRPAPTEVRLGESAWGQAILGLPHTDAAGWLARAKLALGTVSAPRILGPRRPRSSPVVGASPWWSSSPWRPPVAATACATALPLTLDAGGGPPGSARAAPSTAMWGMRGWSSRRAPSRQPRLLASGGSQRGVPARRIPVPAHRTRAVAKSLVRGE